MRRAISCLIILVLTASLCQAQTAVRFGKDTVYKFSARILPQSVTNGVVDYAKAAQDFSYISDYKNIMACDARIRQPFGKLSKVDSLYFSTLEIVDARQYIIERAKKEKIIVINEAHHIPYHRVFIASLLKDLYNAGYRYYGAETINYLDTLINKRKYPVINSGYYTVEPQFGELVRQALGYGYHIFAYEARSMATFADPELREIEQAKNIQSILKEDLSAKILLHAGYDHIREDSLGGNWKMAMAGRLKQLTGIDPFTINQEVMTERSQPSLENPYYTMLNVERPSILIDKDGNLFAGPRDRHLYDVRMVHPRTRLVKGRPDWLTSNGARFTEIPVKELPGFPCLVQAYVASEDPDVAVPVDVVEIAGANDMKPLVLRPGKYVVKVRSDDNKVTQFELTAE